MVTLTRDKLESIIEDIKVMSDYPWHHKLNFILENDQAQRAVIAEQEGKSHELECIISAMSVANKKLDKQIEQQAKEIVELKSRIVEILRLNEEDKEFVSRVVVKNTKTAVEENKTLREALQLLYDCQNGCPLPKYEADWNRAMKLAEQALKEKVTGA